jgi:hypothetical protein
MVLMMVLPVTSYTITCPFCVATSHHITACELVSQSEGAGAGAGAGAGGQVPVGPTYVMACHNVLSVARHIQRSGGVVALRICAHSHNAGKP